MKPSSKIKRLFVIALAIIILALAANSGITASERGADELAVVHGLPDPVASPDIDPRALDYKPVASPPIAPKVVKPVVKPLVSAEAYLVANLETGEVYNSHNSKAVFPIASLSKLVTAITALHAMPSDQKITITQSMLDAYGDAGGLVLGEVYTVSELLAPLLLESSNDAAEAYAQSYGSPEFIAKMNAFVAELGMDSTSFRDPSGLSSRNVSNAENLLLLARHIYANEKPLLEATRQLKVSIASSTEHGAHTWNTINPFPLDPHFIGGKTGRTIEAKESMVSLFRYDTATASYPVAIIVLRSDFSVREFDSAYLMEQFIQKIDKI